MDKLMLCTDDMLVIDMILHYKFLTLKQLKKLLNIEIDANYLQILEDKHLIKALKHKDFDDNLENIYFAVPNTQIEIDTKRYFKDIDLRQISISEKDYFHIYNTVGFHILFDEFTRLNRIKINYFSAYYDAFKNKTKKNELEASGRFELKSGKHLIPNATMNFTLESGEEYFYALELFCEYQKEEIVERIISYNQVFIEDVYKLDRVVFVFEDIDKSEDIQHILDSEILLEHKNNFIFKTIEQVEGNFSSDWMLFYSLDSIDFLSQISKTVVEVKKNIIEVPKKEEVEKVTFKQKLFNAFKNNFKTFMMIFVENTALLLYLSAGIAAFVVSAYMEMIAFNSFYPGFILISVVMVIAFEVAKVGSIFVKVYIKNSKTDMNKISLKIISAVFIPLLFGLSIISSMAVTADKLESPHAEELKEKSIKKIQTEYNGIVKMTEKDHLRRTQQLKQDFFEKIKEFENRKKKVIEAKDAQIEKQKTIYGSDGKTWKGSKYEEHVKERKELIKEFSSERMQIEHLYNAQQEQEAKQYRKEEKEDLKYKQENLNSAESEVLADSWQAQNEMVRSFIKVVNHGFHINLKELDFIFMLSILISILLELTIYKVFSNVAVVYAIRKKL